MIRRTLGDVKQTIALAIGACVTDPMIVEYVNQATETIMNRGKWVGTWQRLKMCLSHTGCVTWPRQISTVEAFAVCSCPGVIQNEWYEFDQNGPGVVDSGDDVGLRLIDRGTACVFEDIIGVNKKVKVYADVAEDAAAVITIQGYDENFQWIRTQVLGVWIDGEQVAIVSGAPVTSTNIFTSITGVLKPETNGPVRLYELTPVTLVQRPIAVYEPSETRPVYRRSIIPNLGNMNGCCTTEDEDECPRQQVTIMAKLQYIPVAIDNDWLLISNIMALKWMIKSIVKAEQNLVTDSELYDRKAMKLLQEELATYEGDGVVVNVRFQNNQTFGAGAVMNVI